MAGQCAPIEDAGPDATGGHAGTGGTGGTGGTDAGPDAPFVCPADMVAVNGEFCMDRFEASRPDATEDFGGVDSSKATSRYNVKPWYAYDLTKETAAQACAAAGKRLCTPDEFQVACSGPDGTVYPYGDTYDPVICNGIDTYCYCSDGTPCEGISPCPYAHCFDRPPPGETEPATGCGSAHQVVPTGRFERCTNEFFIYDLSGNVWELVDDGGAGLFRGGAYNCIDSEMLHRCDYVATSPMAKGFRCCL